MLKKNKKKCIDDDLDLSNKKYIQKQLIVYKNQ